jgi:glycosyltransferase 2 family protein
MSYERVLANEPGESIAASQTPDPGGENSEAERSLSLGERMRSPRTIASFVIAGIIIFLAFRSLNVDFGDVVAQVRGANPIYLGFAFLAYYGSFPVRATRWRFLLRNAGISRTAGFAVPNTFGLSEIYVLSWFVNCVVPAKLGDAYRGYLLKKHAGPSFSRTLGTIFAERLLDIVALVGLMVLSGLFVFHGTVPRDLRGWFIVGAVLVIVGITGLIVLMTASHRIEALVPQRGRPYYNRLSAGIVTSFSRNGFWSVSALTVLIWIFEGARVYFAAKALGVDLEITSAIFVALLASLLTTFPFTPAGVGVVEFGVVKALERFDITTANATAIALVDRGIASYSVILIGGLLYLFSKRK